MRDEKTSHFLILMNS